MKLAQELDSAMTEFLMGKSVVTQRRDIVLGRHCESWLQTLTLYPKRNLV